MVALLADLRREMNGAVVDSMRDKGIEYPLSYGVSIPTIRALARPLAPDDELARLLYRQEVRELKLAALSIASPESVTAGELPFWAAGIVTVEMAENAAAVLICRSAAARDAAREWLRSDDPLLRYAAMLVGSRCEIPLAELLPPLGDALASVPEGLEAVTAHGAAVLLAARGAANDSEREAARAFIYSLPQSSLRDRIEAEAGWQL